MSENILGSGGSYVINADTHEMVLQERTAMPGEASSESPVLNEAVEVKADAVTAPKASAKKSTDIDSKG